MDGWVDGQELLNNEAIRRLYDKPFNVDLTAQWRTGLKLRTFKHILSCLFMHVEQNLLESPAEVSVENCVNDGIQAAVAVSDPEKQIKQRFWNGTILSADRL